MTSPSAARADGEDWLKRSEARLDPGLAGSSYIGLQAELKEARRVVTALLEALRETGSKRAQSQHETIAPSEAEAATGQTAISPSFRTKSLTTLHHKLQLFIAFVGEGHVDFPKTLTELSDAVALFECAEEDCADAEARPALTVERLSKLLREAELVLRGPDNYDALGDYEREYCTVAPVPPRAAE